MASGALTLVISGGAVAFVLQPPELPSRFPRREALVATVGRVVDINYVSGGPRGRSSTFAIPVVEYTVDGRAYRLATRARYRPSPVRLGETTLVLRLSASPETAWLEIEYEDPAVAEGRARRMSRVWAAMWGLVGLAGVVLFLAGWRLPYLDRADRELRR